MASHSETIRRYDGSNSSQIKSQHSDECHYEHGYSSNEEFDHTSRDANNSALDSQWLAQLIEQNQQLSRT